MEGATQAVVGIADAAAHIQDVARDQAAKAKEAARSDDNEFNIRKNFLDNTVDAIRKATVSQYNIVIRTDQEHDDFQDLQGEILPMNLVEVEVAQGKTVNFQVSVFDTGKYLRHGKWERDHWWWWGSTKQWTDPAAMHVHFEKAQPKLDPTAIKQQQDKKAADDKTAADAAAAAKAAQSKAAADSAAALKLEADKKTADSQMAAQNQATANGYGGQSSQPNQYANQYGNQNGNQNGNQYGNQYGNQNGNQYDNQYGSSPVAGPPYGSAATQIMAPFGKALLPHIGTALAPVGRSFLKPGY